MKEIKKVFSNTCIGQNSKSGVTIKYSSTSPYQIFINEYWTHFCYVFDEQLEEVNVYEHWKSISGIEDIDSPSYPNPRIQKLKDGSLLFHDSEKGSIGIYHSTGTYTVINGTKLEVKDGQINLAGEADNLVTWAALNTILQNLATALTSHPHSDPISGSTGSPNTAFTVDISGAKAEKVKTS